MANILGIQTVDSVNIISVDVNPSLGLGTPSPTGSFAIAVDGSGFFYKNGASDTNWILSVLAPYLGVARYVYLVQDSTDVTKLGGTTNNVYSTFQAAYDAANTLQVALGGTNRVAIIIGNVTSASVGDVTLTADWNSYVSLVGISKNDSVLGNIIADNASANGFSIIANFSNVTIGNVNSDATGVSGDGGYIEIVGENLVVGNISASVTDVTNTIGNSGSVNVNSQANARSVIYGDINLTSGSAGYISGLTIQSSQDLSFGNITLNGNLIGGSTIIWFFERNINITSLTIAAGASSSGLDMYFSGVKFDTISITGLVATSNINFQNCLSNNTTITSLGTTNVNINGCDFSDIFGASSRTYQTNSTVKTIAENSSFYQITNLGNSSRLQSCAVGLRITNIGTGCIIVNSSFNGATANITNGSAVTVIGDGTYFRTAPAATVTITNKYSTPATVRYVYLVQDASDAAKLGGTYNNVYTTFQTAYDAANALQVALGGTNKVVVMVGNTTAAAVGNLTLTTQWNINISFIGYGVTSEVGNVSIIPSSGGSYFPKFTNMKIGDMTLKVSCTLTLNNCNVGNITGQSGLISSYLTLVGQSNNIGNITDASTVTTTININIALTDSSILSITLSSSTLNVGNVNFATSTFLSNNVIIGAITQTQTATTGVFSVGHFNVTSSKNITVTSLTQTMASTTAGCSVGGINVDSASSVVFTGNVVCTGFITSNTASDTYVNEIVLNNCQFLGSYFSINCAAVSTGYERGGYIKTVTINKCTFASRVRFNYNTVSAIITGINFNVNDCIFKSASAIAGIAVSNHSVSFTSLLFSNCVCNDLNYGIYVTNGDGVSTVPFMVDGNSIQFVNCDSVVGAEIYNPSTPNTVDDVVIKNCNGQALYFSIIDGDANMNVSNSSFSDIIFYSSSSAAITKQQIITSSNIGASTIMQFVTPTTFVIKNSHFETYTDTLNPYTFDVIAYNSFIESKADAGSTITYTGTLYTSTLKKLATDIVAGLTNNNSYIF